MYIDDPSRDEAVNRANIFYTNILPNNFCSENIIKEAPKLMVLQKLIEGCKNEFDEFFSDYDDDEFKLGDINCIKILKSNKVIKQLPKYIIGKFFLSSLD